MAELIDKTLDLIEFVGRSGSCSLPDISAGCEIPRSTAHRIASDLAARGYLVSEKRGRYRLGASVDLLSRQCDMRQVLIEVARRPLRELARECRAHAHLAVLDEDMVTYLVKQRHSRSAIHSEENMQLEAYCTAIGKMLLAYLPEDALDTYLETDSFVALTDRTLTDPDVIRSHLAAAKARGWATEIEETVPNLMCLAVPILGIDGSIQAAISLSLTDEHPSMDALLDRLPALQRTRGQIERALFPGRPPEPARTAVRRTDDVMAGALNESDAQNE